MWNERIYWLIFLQYASVMKCAAKTFRQSKIGWKYERQRAGNRESSRSHHSMENGMDDVDVMPTWQHANKEIRWVTTSTDDHHVCCRWYCRLAKISYIFFSYFTFSALNLPPFSPLRWSLFSKLSESLISGMMRKTRSHQKLGQSKVI